MHLVPSILFTATGCGLQQGTALPYAFVQHLVDLALAKALVAAVAASYSSCLQTVLGARCWGHLLPCPSCRGTVSQTHLWQSPCTGSVPSPPLQARELLRSHWHRGGFAHPCRLPELKTCLGPPKSHSTSQGNTGNSI